MVPAREDSDDGDIVSSVIRLISSIAFTTHGTVVDPAAMERWTVDEIFSTADNMIDALSATTTKKRRT